MATNLLVVVFILWGAWPSDSDGFRNFNTSFEIDIAPCPVSFAQAVNSIYIGNIFSELLHTGRADTIHQSAARGRTGGFG